MKDYTKLLDVLLVEVPEMSQFVTCGRHSGFPDCCVWFFMSQWLPAYLQRTTFFEEYGAKIDEAMPGYVPCPTCLENKTFVEVKRCDCAPEE